ncbi:hypothetical protein [Salinirussus salinus]|uniref:hypothetical protein n=1 Tax=Salinirussus salinus TaxID=1198300 RepID=UPI00135696CE|nr:hypothetical protein [Salinirussus salinus]
MHPRWRQGRRSVAGALAGGVALMALVAPAAAQRTSPDRTVEQAVREAVRAAAPDPVFILGVAAVGGFVGALLANALWNVRRDSSRDGQPGPQAGGAPGGPTPGAGGRGQRAGRQPQQSGQAAPQDQPLAGEPGDQGQGGQQGTGGPLGESRGRDQQR